MNVVNVSIENFPSAKQAGFSDSELESFQQDGYVIVRDLVDSSLLDTMKQVTIDHLQQKTGPVELEVDLKYPGAPESRSNPGGQTIRRLKQAIARHPVFLEWLSCPEFVSRLQQLLGPNVVMPLAHHNCIMTKQPCFSSDTGWHQDVRYWSFTKPELVSAWLALGEETSENGCLRLIPGTHREHFTHNRLDKALFLRDDIPENLPLIGKQIEARLQPGDVLFFHSRTFHSATRNRTDQPKFSAVFTFRPADNPPIPGTRSASMPELHLPSHPPEE